MPSVIASTSWFRKLSWVSTFATPWGHLLAVSMVLGGTNPQRVASVSMWNNCGTSEPNKEGSAYEHACSCRPVCCFQRRGSTANHRAQGRPSLQPQRERPQRRDETRSSSQRKSRRRRRVPPRGRARQWHHRV